MKYSESMFVWNDNSSNVIAISWPDKAAHGKHFQKSGGACYSHVQQMDFEQRKAHAFIEAMHLIIRDGVCPHAVHKAFLNFDEYRDGCSSDMPGIKGKRQ